ncbi:MAG: hypothetical protein Q8P85_17285 [Pseudomonas sp.]|nr:hypothetical protein [Pseudomonas sp.]
MKFRLLLLFVLLLALSACTVYSGGYGGYRPPYDPPPYGQWRWDPGLSVYVSLGHTDLYFSDRYYYRWYDGGWHWSSRYDGPWQVRDYRQVPPGLYKKYPAPRGAPGYGNSRGDSYQGQGGARGQGNIQQPGKGSIRPAPQGQPRNQGGDNRGGQWQQQNQGQGVERGQGDSRYQGQGGERGQGNSQQQGKGSIRPVPQGQPRSQGGDNQAGQWQQQNQGQGKGQGQAPY